MVLDDAARLTGPVREHVRVAAWRAPRTPEDGPPDDEQVVVVWSEDGQQITDPARLAELEARYRHAYGEEAI